MKAVDESIKTQSVRAQRQPHKAPFRPVHKSRIASRGKFYFALSLGSLLSRALIQPRCLKPERECCNSRENSTTPRPFAVENNKT